MDALIALLSLAGAGILAWYALKSWKTFSLIKNTPTSPIGELRPGFGEAKGRVAMIYTNF